MKEVRMSDRDLSNDHLATLVENITREVLSALGSDRETGTKMDPIIKPQIKPSVTGRRPRSRYTGQLHLKVMSEDEEWFKLMVRKREVQNGKFFSLMRQKFDAESEKS